MKTITLDTIKAMNVSTFSVQDNSPRGVKTVTAEEIKPGDRVVIDNHFCEVVAAPEQEQAEQQDTTAIDGEDAPGRDVLGEVREYLDTLDDGEKVDIWNEYTDAANSPDDRVYSMDEFDEIFSDKKPWEIARACFYSRRFNPSDSWLWFNGYGNVESADYISDHDDRSPIDLDEVAEYIVSNDDELFNDDIRAILDGEEVRI